MHCCFEYTVVDTEDPMMIGDKVDYATVCECFDDESADKITNALNASNETT